MERVPCNRKVCRENEIISRVRKYRNTAIGILSVIDTFRFMIRVRFRIFRIRMVGVIEVVVRVLGLMSRQFLKWEVLCQPPPTNIMVGLDERK